MGIEGITTICKTVANVGITTALTVAAVKLKKPLILALIPLSVGGIRVATAKPTVTVTDAE